MITMDDTLTDHEIEILEMLGGRRTPAWGDWVGACLESLASAGLCTSGPKYLITEAGERRLAEIDEDRSYG